MAPSDPLQTKIKGQQNQHKHQRFPTSTETNWREPFVFCRLFVFSGNISNRGLLGMVLFCISTFVCISRSLRQDVQGLRNVSHPYTHGDRSFQFVLQQLCMDVDHEIPRIVWGEWLHSRSAWSEQCVFICFRALSWAVPRCQFCRIEQIMQKQYGGTSKGF